MIFFATAAMTAANAQEARAQVYKTPPATDVFNTGATPQDTLADIAADIVSGSANNLPSFLAFIDPDDGGALVIATTLSNGLPVIAGGGGGNHPRENTEIRAGDRIRWDDTGFSAGVFTEIFRVYENAGGDLALAEGDDPVTLAATVDTAAGEFFLTNDWEYTTNATLGTRGHVPATGGGGGGNTGGDGAETAVVGDNDSNARDLAVVGLGVGVVGFMAAYLSGGDFSLFNFAPDYGYSLTESGYAYNVGGRLNFRKDNWHLYSAVGQTNANGNFGDFRYESGGEYSADLWTAAFSETVQGETADYRFSLSADYHGGIWKVSPTYRLHSKFAEEEFQTQNSLNLEGVLRYNRWTIRPSAGFRWESASEFGDNARFNLSAVRRF